MPIYAYKCRVCGYAQDVLQKISDAPLSVCPECSQSAFSKQVTAAGFQLKGSGWYVTDFRGAKDNGNDNSGQPATAASAPPAAAENAAPAANAPAAAGTPAV